MKSKTIILRLPYVGNVSMYIMLPQELPVTQYTFDAFVQEVARTPMHELLADIRSRIVRVQIPKMVFPPSYSLGAVNSVD